MQKNETQSHTVNKIRNCISLSLDILNLTNCRTCTCHVTHAYKPCIKISIQKCDSNPMYFSEQQSTSEDVTRLGLNMADRRINLSN